MTAGTDIAARIKAGLERAGTRTGSGPLISTLRKAAADPSETVRETPWDNAAASYTYHDLTSLDDRRQVRDKGGLIGETRRTLMVDATGAVPTKADQVAVGVASAAVDADTEWIEILEVRPISPGGTVLFYEMDLKL